MGSFLARRMGQGLITILVVVSLVFVVLNLSGDPVRMMLPPTASQEQVEEMRRALGLDQPLPLRYFNFVGRMARLDFGESIQHRRPAMEVVLERFPATLMLAAAALGIAAVVGVPLGVAAAVKRRTPIDALVVGLSVLGQSTPVFWIAMVLIFLFAIVVPVFPPSGFGSPAHVVLPSLSISLFLLAGVTRVTRASTIGVLGQPFVTVARAKGLPPLRVLGGHVLRNAAIPVITQLSLQIRFVIGGSVVVESVFGWPGVGQLLARAAFARDYPIVISATFGIALLIVVFNIALDLAYTAIDPRIRV